MLVRGDGATKFAALEDLVLQRRLRNLRRVSPNRPSKFTRPEILQGWQLEASRIVFCCIRVHRQRSMRPGSRTVQFFRVKWILIARISATRGCLGRRDGGEGRGRSIAVLA